MFTSTGKVRGVNGRRATSASSTGIFQRIRTLFSCRYKIFVAICIINPLVICSEKDRPSILWLSSRIMYTVVHISNLV